MNDFLARWATASYTTLGFFWMALWAFILGYALSGFIQVFVSSSRMQKALGKANARSVILASFFGFISSSCSFSALATTKSLFRKGAGFVSSIAFLLASTNLVIELGIVISVFLGWQFVMGEYVGGILLILISWLLIALLRPGKLIQGARQRLGADEEQEQEQNESFWQRLQDADNWSHAGMQYVMEWKMVWKDVTLGFTIAGLIAAFVPNSFFSTLFTGVGSTGDPGFFTLLQEVLTGPVAAFLTFIGSMGNIPLAALLYSKGVSFAGVMAFIFSDLVVFPVLRINARYYGWKMALFILFLLFVSLVVASLLLHYGLDITGLLPAPSHTDITTREFFQLDYTFWFNIFFLLLSAVLVYLGYFRKSKSMMQHGEMAPKSPLIEKIMSLLAYASYAWLLAGIVLYLFR